MANDFQLSSTDSGGIDSAAQPVEVSVLADKRALDLPRVLAWMHTTHWAANWTYTQLQNAVEHSVCAAAFAPVGQVGFARLVTDYATFGFLTDVFVDPAWRGRGLARRLATALLDAPGIRHLPHIALLTADAHRVYAPLGFFQPHPGFWMELFRPEEA